MSAEIRPIASKSYDTKQSKLAQLGGCNPARWLLIGKSGSGKGVAMQNLLLNPGLFRGCYARIYVFSPTVHLDSMWVPVREYIENTLKHDEKKEGPFFFDSWDEGALRKIISDQAELVSTQKQRGHTKMHGIAVIVDDFADDPRVTHNPQNVLTSLFLSGRHRFISTYILTQRARSLATPIRTNATGLLFWRCSNQQEYESVEHEVSALVNKKTFRAIYEIATREPFSFLFVRLNAKTLDQTFMVRFEKSITFGEESPEE